jgi:hypothetical protein
MELSGIALSARLYEPRNSEHNHSANHPEEEEMRPAVPADCVEISQEYPSEHAPRLDSNGKV